MESASSSWQRLSLPPTLMSWSDWSSSGASVKRRLEVDAGFSADKRCTSSGKLSVWADLRTQSSAYLKSSAEKLSPEERAAL